MSRPRMGGVAGQLKRPANELLALNSISVPRVLITGNQSCQDLFDCLENVVHLTELRLVSTCKTISSTP